LVIIALQSLHTVPKLRCRYTLRSVSGSPRGQVRAVPRLERSPLHLDALAQQHSCLLRKTLGVGCLAIPTFVERVLLVHGLPVQSLALSDRSNLLVEREPLCGVLLLTALLPALSSVYVA
jgi:hypothetical protein